MIRKLFRTSRADAPAAASLVEGVRVYAIGDVHGCRAELERLLGLIEADDAERGGPPSMLIFLGDLVDRGPDSAGVIERLLQLAGERPNTRFLKGNHEEVLLSALEGERQALRLFCRVGGRETAISYGISGEDYDRYDFDELIARLDELVPASHRDFLRAFEDMIELGDYAFVHAGIRPEIPLDQQRGSDLRWIRETFLDYRRPHPRIIVHGHTISEEVDRQPNRIGIDTGAYATGRLTALGLEGSDSWVLHS
ncbi:metallophosphoesterase family protein [Sphingomonas sp.]|jgi:serine/threonine protein phosphatase 1|uniref:metallophosphoesterase family protein n=1 Tax=Sphingomonas sp. TaxID=28214 RepID=UPI0035C7A142